MGTTLNTGGPEALHQLADSCSRQGFECSLHYYEGDLELAAHFACYSRVHIVDEIPDEPDCVVVVPESAWSQVQRFRRARVVLWWLAVDETPGLVSHLGNPEILHACQSEYACRFVQERGAARSYLLQDYINETYRAVSGGSRLNLVAFNPRKGIEFTRLIVARLGETYGFAPLTGLDREQVKDLLRRAKAYIDFGPHPGKDRLPREAALMGSCVIVGDRGSARNAIDVPIPAAYKLAVLQTPAVDGKRIKLEFDLDATCQLIDSVMLDFERHAQAFEPYVKRIALERDEFDRQVGALFGELRDRATRGLL